MYVFFYCQRLNKLIIPEIEEKRDEIELEDREGHQAALLTKDNEQKEQKA